MATISGLMESGFHASIDAAPDDRTVRLVYADWLEDKERFVEAEFWRWVSEKQRAPIRKRSSIEHLHDWSKNNPPLKKWGWLRSWYFEPGGSSRPGRPSRRTQLKTRCAQVPPPLDGYLGNIERTEHGWLWWSTTPYHAFNHLYLVWSQVLTPEERQACWEWEPPK
jgi:uncharacterized protein (TIGR02996 family)